jgi:ATP-binding protein involved in chromosome partitioning
VRDLAPKSANHDNNSRRSAAIKAIGKQVEPEVPVTNEDILTVLQTIGVPGGGNLADSGRLTQIVNSGGKIIFSIAVEPSEVNAMESVRAAAEAAVRRLDGVSSALVGLTGERPKGSTHPAARPVARPAPVDRHPGERPVRSAPPAGSAPTRGAVPQQAGIPGVKHIIAVASGKGGVGKSTTAANLALALAATGQKIGLLDADIYGPSQPRLFGVSDKPALDENKKILPHVRHGIKIMSIGFMVEENTAMIWRGPMVMSALTQMLREVAWGELDVLVVDMPPGTGDAQLTMAQQVPLSGAVIVSTPQDLALIDARRGVAMFHKVNVPVLGIVENMSSYCCPNCGHVAPIFGHGGAKAEAQKTGVAFLGEIPLDMEIRTTSDEGTPIVATSPGSPHAKAYMAIAANVTRALVGQNVKSPPRIVIE